jgi:3-keto-5-aminohexanoate cleavage enzyme
MLSLFSLSEETRLTKIMIEAAVNGVTTRDQNRNVAYRPDEVAADAIAASTAGASLVHVHAREPDGSWSDNADYYTTIYGKVRETQSPPLLWPTFAGGKDVKKRYGHFGGTGSSASKPDLGACDMGSLNVTRWDAKTRSFTEQFVYENSVDFLIEAIRYMADLGFRRPTLQIFDATFLRTTLKLLEMGVLAEPLLLKFYLGSEAMPFGLPPTPKSIEMYADMLKGVRASWFVAVLGADVIPLVPHTVALGGHVRIGLEDYPHTDKGQPTNAELVGAAVKIIEAMGHEVATAADARKMLEL